MDIVHFAGKGSESMTTLVIWQLVVTLTIAIANLHEL